MTPKEKAKELINMYYQKVADSSYPEDLAKQCALIAVDEIIKISMDNLYSERYWQQVKQEIEAQCSKGKKALTCG